MAKLATYLTYLRFHTFKRLLLHTISNQPLWRRLVMCELELNVIKIKILVDDTDANMEALILFNPLILTGTALSLGEFLCQI